MTAKTYRLQFINDINTLHTLQKPILKVFEEIFKFTYAKFFDSLQNIIVWVTNKRIKTHLSYNRDYNEI